MRILTFVALITVIIYGCGNNATNNDESADTNYSPPWSVRMAQSTMKRYPEAWMMEGRTKPKWSYSHGVTLLGFEALWKKTGENKYLQYIIDYADTCIRPDGSIINYSLEEYNIDRVSNGKFLMDLYEVTGTEKFRIAVNTLKKQMETHPRTSEKGFWHKKRYPWQMWLDGIYMASPFLAEYAEKMNEPILFDDIANQVTLIYKKTKDPKTGLLYHAWDEKKQQSWCNPETGQSKNFWGRAMGWYTMAIVDVLDYLPENHPKRQEIINIFNEVTKAIIKVQNDSTGLWYQVLDQGGREGNYFECTVACMFTYSMLKAIRMGYIDEKYLPNAEKAYKGILDNLVVIDPDGEIHLSQCNSVAGLSDDRPGTYEYYIHEAVGMDDPKGVGPFILASLEMENLKN